MSPFRKLLKKLQHTRIRMVGSVIWNVLIRHGTNLLLICSILLLTMANRGRSVTETHSEPGLRVSYGDISDAPRNTRACPILPSELGLVGIIPVNQTAPSWQELDQMFPDVLQGGHWSPRDCVSRSRLAIVIPYRDRDYNLRVFLQHMHPFLQKQQLQYTIFVAEQAGNTTFNRGIMRNIGFQEANKHDEYECTTFNDVDLLPEHDMNYYGCPDLPRHMCIALDYFNYTPIASGAVFGGIVSFRNDHFWRVNGYSNLYFGWGGEDDDIMSRCRRTGVGFYRTRPQYGRYKGTPHKKDRRRWNTYKLWRWRDGRAEWDGLNSLTYKVVRREQRKSYTWVLTEVDENRYQQDADNYLLKIDKMRAKVKIENSKKERIPRNKTISRKQALQRGRTRLRIDTLQSTKNKHSNVNRTI